MVCCVRMSWRCRLPRSTSLSTSASLGVLVSVLVLVSEGNEGRAYALPLALDRLLLLLHSCFEFLPNLCQTFAILDIVVVGERADADKRSAHVNHCCCPAALI